MIKLDLTYSEAKTIVRALDFLMSKADTNVGTMIEVDRLCRKECIAHWRELRNAINARLPKRQRVF